MLRKEAHADPHMDVYSRTWANTHTKRHTLRLTKIHIQIYTHTEIYRFAHMRHKNTQRITLRHTHKSPEDVHYNVDGLT